MNCQLRSLCVVALAGVLLSLASRADAQPVVDLPRIEVVTPPEKEPVTAQPGAPTVNDRALILDIRGARGSDPILFRELGSHLRRSGITIVERTPSDSAQPCENDVCLQELGRRENVGFLISAQVDEPVAGTFAVTMSLFDGVRRASLQEKAECLQCNQALLIYKLNDVADVLIARTREARLSAPAQNQSPNPPSATSPPPAGTTANPTLTARRGPPPPQPGFFARLPRSRKIIATVLGGLAGAALLTSIVLTTTNGLDTPIGCELRTDVVQDKCILNNKALYASGYALTGALAVGIGFALFWPTKKPAQAAAQEVR